MEPPAQWHFFGRGLHCLFPDIRTDLGIRGSLAADGVTGLSREGEKAIFSSRFDRFARPVRSRANSCRDARR